MKLEAEVSADIPMFIRRNAQHLKKNDDSRVPVYEQGKHYGSMSAVGIKVKILTNESIILIFSRIWYAKSICYSACNPDRSYIYVEAWTSNYDRTFHSLSLKDGKIIKFPMVLNITEPELDECCLGPEDPRIVINKNGKIFLSFNMIDVDKRRKIWLYDIFADYQVPISTPRKSKLAVEKNWTPFVKNDRLYFIYSFKPLKILHCLPDKGTCQFISSTHSSYQTSYLRGGTQLVRFRDTDYFVGVARSTVSCGKCQRFYRPHLIVLSTAHGKFHLAYVSEPLMLDAIPMFASYVISQKKSFADFCENVIRIMTPGSIIDWEWSLDKLTFTISINDKRSFIVSIIGFEEVLRKIILSIETEYSQTFLNDEFDLKMSSYGEETAFSYCKDVSETNKLIYEKLKVIEEHPKEKVIKNVVESPTYPTFRVASNTIAEVLISRITNDFVNYGLIGRYLIEYTSVYDNLSVGTHLMVDAGGNHGTYALYGASLNQSVLIFEVLLDYWVLIQESIRINSRLDERMTLYPFGVSDERGLWKIVPQEGLTHIEFIKSETSNTGNQSLSNVLGSIQTYPLDDFVFQKISVMKIDVEGFEIRALKGASRIIRTFGVGAILIEIATNRWSWNNITLQEGISVLQQVTLMGNYSSYLIARNDEICPASQISKLNGVVDAKNLSMINQKNGKYEIAPQIFHIAHWAPIIVQMKNNDWSCNFWLESDLKRVNVGI